MALPFNAAGIRKVMGGLMGEGSAKGRRVITELTLVVERQAKLNVSYAPHKRGTPTTAVPGKGPGLISGTLRRAITHTEPQPAGFASWTSKVGLATGFTPRYSNVPAAEYGRRLERGEIRGGNAYPFLGPAVKFGQHIAGPAIYRKHFNRWPRLD